MAYPFTGVDHRGYGRAGVCPNPATFAEKCYRQGWRSLDISDEDGNLVGGIGVPPGAVGRRTWWGEDAAFIPKRQD